MPEHVTVDVSRWLDSLNLLPSEGCALMWVGGSRAYGLAGEDSDVDVHAVAGTRTCVVNWWMAVVTRRGVRSV